MRLPDDQTRYSNQWKYIELAYINDQGKLKREMIGEHQPLLVEWKDVPAYREKHKNTGIYTSAFHYNSRDINAATRLGSLYFDLDSAADVEASYRDVCKLYGHLRQFVPGEAINVYFTGKKGFHVECEAIALGITPSNELPHIFRFIANDIKEVLGLETLDFAVYDLRRIWRLPNSRHQETSLFKRHLSAEELCIGIDGIRKLAEEPSSYVVPEQEFSMSANEWYREYTYRIEKEKQDRSVTPAMLLERFQKNGTSINRTHYIDSEKEFTPKELFESCPAIIRLWEKAEEKSHLEHEERLFLCSILTYTDDAIEYLHAILSNCSDYNPEKTKAHIQDWIRRRELDIGGRPFSCERANSAGVGCGQCSLEPRKKWVKVGDTLVESEEYSKPSPIRYAYKNKPKQNLGY